MQGYTKRIVEWSNGLLAASKSQYEEVTKSIKGLKNEEAALLEKMKDCKDQEKLKKLLKDIIDFGSKTESIKCYTTFEETTKDIFVQVTNDIQEVVSAIKQVQQLYGDGDN